MKKNIAFSTSSNLVVISIIASNGIFGLVILHIILHSFCKASIFMESRVKIHNTNSQDIRVNENLNLRMWLLIRVVVYISSKEIVVSYYGLFGFIIFLMCYGYNKMMRKGFKMEENYCIFVSILILVVLNVGLVISGGLIIFFVLGF